METLPEATLAEFIRYNNWANQQVLEACHKLNEDQLAANTPGTYGTIRDTLAHIIEGEAFYVGLLTGHRPPLPFKWEDRPSLSEMTEYAVRVGNALADAAHRIRPTDLIDDAWDGKHDYYRALAIFIQIINHGVEHRTNITTILNAEQHTPPGVDGWAYLWAHPDRFDVKRVS